MQLSPPVPHLYSPVHACWLGKSIGGTLGLPAEGRAGPLNFSFYDPIPTVAPPNDDLELQLVWLHIVEQLDGCILTQQDLAQAWLNHIHYMWDEYGRCRWNLRRGVPPAACGSFENPFVSGMGSPIRSEFWACLFPGDAASAAYYAALDASLDHGIEGIAGEVFFAVMQAEVLGGKNLDAAIRTALGKIPAETETATAVTLTLAGHDRGAPEWTTWKRLVEAHGSENFTHAPLNVALTIWALLHGDGDFEKSILLAVNGGYDTDCTAASAGATLGLMLGAEKIPERWSAPIGNSIFIGPGIQGINAPTTLEALTERTLALQGKLAPTDWDALDWARLGQAPQIDPGTLLGTIGITPLGGTEPALWANGELPPVVKSAGGAIWQWHCGRTGEYSLIALARSGAKLFIDNQCVVDCPPGLEYVPATHRCAKEAQAPFSAQSGRTYSVRIELGRAEANQAASVLLTYPNRHIAPWTKEELPHPARLRDKKSS